MRRDSLVPAEANDIPLQRPYTTGQELTYVTKVVATGRTVSDGEYTRGCARLLQERLRLGRVLMTPSCTASLELAAMLCRLGPGDEVILPSYTFVSTANAVARLGARPVFVDIRPDTLNLDETLLGRAVTPRTRAVIPVHYGGVACAMDPILAVARAHGLRVIEDAAQAVNAFYRGRALGGIGHLGTFSFHATKNFGCGEGGALCVNDPELFDRAEVLREKGTNRSQFARGEVSKYTWVDVGSSYVPSEIACAYLLAQLEAMDAITALRREADGAYRRLLRPLEEEGRLRLPRVPEGCVSNYHNFYVVLNSGRERDGLMAHLKQRGVGAAFHFVPLHTSPMGQTYSYREGSLPVTEDMSRRMLRLPLFPGITGDELRFVVGEVRSFLALGRAAVGFDVGDTAPPAHPAAVAALAAAEGVAS
jgi:dTDP-4-amino-4,6-dideoxygalactose transaminase